MIKKRAEKEAESIAETKNLNTFEKIARERLAIAQNEISESHFNRTMNALVNDCFPVTGAIEFLNKRWNISTNEFLPYSFKSIPISNANRL